MRNWIQIINEYADPDKRKDDTFYQGTAHYAPKMIWERPGFKEWFAGSHVCAPNGEPLIAFHGSFEQFSEFKLVSERRRSYGFNRLGYWFDIDPRTPEYFAGYTGKTITTKVGGIMPCVLSIKKPFSLDSEFIYTPDVEALNAISVLYDEISELKWSASHDSLGNLVNRETGEPLLLRDGRRLTDTLSRKIENEYDEKRRAIMTYEHDMETGPRIDAFGELMKMLPNGAKSTDAEVEAFKQQLIAEGHDGIYLGDTAADFKTRGFAGTDWWIAFYPNQIKSIYAKSFTSSPDIGR